MRPVSLLPVHWLPSFGELAQLPTLVDEQTRTGLFKWASLPDVTVFERLPKGRREKLKSKAVWRMKSLYPFTPADKSHISAQPGGRKWQYALARMFRN